MHTRFFSRESCVVVVLLKQTGPDLVGTESRTQSRPSQQSSTSINAMPKLSLRPIGSELHCELRNRQLPSCCSLESVQELRLDRNRQVHARFRCDKRSLRAWLQASLQTTSRERESRVSARLLLLAMERGWICKHHKVQPRVKSITIDA